MNNPVAKLATSVCFVCNLTLASATAAPLEFRYGFDVFSDKTTQLHSFQSMSLMYDMGSGFSIGQTVFSASTGNAGGLFIGGFEVAKRMRLGRGLALEFGAFVGGGGGAEVVTGDGLMTRTHATLIKQITPDWAATLGLSYIKITGTTVSTPALGFGISRKLQMRVAGGHHPPYDPTYDQGVEISAIKPVMKAYIPQNSNKRSGGALDNVYLMGAELTFSLGQNTQREMFLSAFGAAGGDGEGYAEYQLGYRWFSRPDGLRSYAQIAAGFAGGGDIDTGGGLITSAGAGVIIPFTPHFSAEIGALAITAIDGDFTAISPFVTGVISFGGKPEASGPNSRRWQISTGLTQQYAHSGYRLAGTARTGDPVLVETSIDLFFTDHLYFTGNAQTAVLGDAGAYAVGQLGMGYEIPVGGRWTLSPEIFVGAAGGAGIDTGGGLIVGGKIEIDYALSDNLKLSLGLGKFVSRGGAKPLTAHFGVKIPFTSFH